MDLKYIQELIKAVNKSELSELSIKDGEFEITIKQNPLSTQQFTTTVAQAAPQVMMSAMPMAAPVATTSDATPAAPAATPVSDKLYTIKSPMIGTLYRSPKPGEPAFVNVGDTINAGEHICIIEAMKLFNEIESEVTGKIVKVLADDVSPVEYDQPLFLVELS